MREEILATKRWLQIQQLQRHFWTKFEGNHLSYLQKRHKWKKLGKQLAEGELVLIKENDLSPLSWKTARVTEVYPDPKGVVRQVKLRTAGKDNVHRADIRIHPFSFRSYLNF